LAAALIVGGALSTVDRVWKLAPHFGFAPEDVVCAAAAPNVPLVWDLLGRSDTGKALTEQAPQRVHAATLAVRKATGIRPTPVRWRVWMGSQALFGWRGDGDWGVCVRPGLVMRAALLLNRAFTRNDDGVFAWRDLHYAWQSGFLIVSPSIAYVRAARNAPPRSVPEEEVFADGVTVYWTQPFAGMAILRLAEGGVEITGRLDTAWPANDPPLQIADLWPEPPVCAVAVRHPEAWGPLLAAAPGMDAALEAVSRVTHPILTQWKLPSLPEHWNRDIDEYAVALLGLDGKGPVPLPTFAAALHNSTLAPQIHPLAGWAVSEHLLPYAWDQHAGSLIPFLGDAFTLCLAGEAPLWLVSSNEPAMARLAGKTNLALGRATAAAVRVDCALLADALGTLLRDAAKAEVLPESAAPSQEDTASLAWARKELRRLPDAEYEEVSRSMLERALALHVVPAWTRENVDREWEPLLHVVEKFGRLSLDVYGEGGHLRFEGRVRKDGAPL
jgi:hypothetical protein